MHRNKMKMVKPVNHANWDCIEVGLWGVLSYEVGMYVCMMCRRMSGVRHMNWRLQM